MDTQTLERQHGARIKFASLRDDGHLDPDCHEEYSTFPKAAPDGWHVIDAGQIQTRHDHERDSWLFSDGDNDVAAVEHETGVEILIDVGVSVGSAAITGFASWAWARWKQSRGAKPASSFVVEKIEDRLSDGTERRVKRVTIRGEVTSAEIKSVLSSL